ncbi:MAG: outer membrane protein assembly factor BamD [Rhodovulum sulfidophilum]|uniref:Outer membrane protein assembly factor BamD n=1 Tax=Rhodovulum sulfidophilum TaxID=35806 RepID=A0A2W5QJF9_RHOSU|nr:MAG: outer membrane protein assembly factor BamD [Rhodovulum sulfidophilum]
MERLTGRGLALVCLFGTSLVLAGCGGGLRLPSLSGESSREAQLEAQTPQQLYMSGEALLSEGNPKAAGDMFGEVERLYPYSDWAKRSMLMSAFAYHEAAQYDQSRSAAQRYIEFYPADVDAPYAQFIIALSYYDQIVDIGRDQDNTFQALQEMRDIIERYPDSEYAKSAQMKFELALDHLAGKEMEIGRYYLNRGHYTAAINRFRVVVEEYQTTTQTPEALYRLVEAYLSLGLTQEAQTAAAILGHNFQGSEWYQRAYALLTGRGLQPENAGDSWLNQTYRQVVLGEWR